jgi:hypothetical protein
MTLGGLPHRARIGHDLLLRSSGRVVQKRPVRSACWADIPQLSTRGEGRPAAWQQYWQQSGPNGVDPRPSVFQAGRIPRLAWIVRVSCAVAGRCRLPLAAGVAVIVAVSSARSSGGKLTRTAGPLGPRTGSGATGPLPGVALGSQRVEVMITGR